MQISKGAATTILISVITKLIIKNINKLSRYSGNLAEK